MPSCEPWLNQANAAANKSLHPTAAALLLFVMQSLPCGRRG